jgi:hypothetical protein
MYGSANEILREYAEAVTLPEQLFHFTDAAGLMAILNERRMRASCASLLNDPSETKHAIKLAQEMVEGGSTFDNSMSIRMAPHRYGRDNIYKAFVGPADQFSHGWCAHRDLGAFSVGSSTYHRDRPWVQQPDGSRR